MNVRTRTLEFWFVVHGMLDVVVLVVDAVRARSNPSSLAQHHEDRHEVSASGWHQVYLDHRSPERTIDMRAANATKVGHPAPFGGDPFRLSF